MRKDEKERKRKKCGVWGEGVRRASLRRSCDSSITSRVPPSHPVHVRVCAWWVCLLCRIVSCISCKCSRIPTSSRCNIISTHMATRCATPIFFSFHFRCLKRMYFGCFPNEHLIGCRPTVLFPFFYRALASAQTRCELRLAAPICLFHACPASPSLRARIRTRCF